MYIELNGTAASEVLDASAVAGATSAVLRGLGGNDTLIGTAGADRLDGGTGGDSMVGGAGDDRFFIDRTSTNTGRDTVDGGLGTDMVVYNVPTSLMTAAIKAELVRLQLYVAAADFSSPFVSDTLRLELRDVDAAVLRVDGTIKTVADALAPAVAAADSYAGTEDQGLSVTAAQGLLANDSSEAGGLRVQAGTVATALGGSVTIAADGGFTYAPAANAAGTDSFGYTLVDVLGRTAAGTATITLAAVNDAASIGGTATGSVAEDGTLSASGQLTITDPDSGEAAFRTPASLAGTYGAFTFDAATGAWGYALDNAAANVQALTAGQTVTDTLTVTSLDGTATQAITVTIAGAADGVTAIRLADIAAGTGGFKIIGEATPDGAGHSVAAVGDMNGDGLADLLIGAPNNDSDGSSGNGAAYVVFGRAGTVTVNLDDVALGTGGFKIVGEADADSAGYSVAAVGDVNGDGRPDLLIGALYNSSDGSTYNGAAYVVFGQAGTATVNLDDVALGTGGFKILGEADSDWAGHRVAAAGDVNGDGRPDLLIGALANDSDGNFGQGAAYVVFGQAGTATVDLDDVALGTGGFKIIGEAESDAAGSWVAAAGDVNGDGLADLLIGAHGNVRDGGYGNGAAYVVFGQAGTAAVNLDHVALGTGGFKILGEADGDNAGISVAAAGDVNGDGRGDLLVGAYFSNSDGSSNNGAAYVVFGQAGTATVDLGQVALGTGGFKIIGEASNDEAGWPVSAAGDLNGDGRADLLIGASEHDSAGNSNTGAAYVVFGKADTAIVDLDDVALGTGGVKIIGEARNDEAGNSLAAVGDVDGDGLADLLVGALRNDSNGEINNGAAYLIHGRPEWLAPVRIAGTTTGAVQEDGTLTAAGTLTLAGSGAAGAAFANPASLAGTYGAFTFDAATGAWTYALDNGAAHVQALAAGRTRTDVLRVATADGSATKAVTVTIAGSNDAAVIGGTGTATVVEDTTPIARGQLTVTDPDAGQAAFATPASLAGTYGSFSFDAATGEWGYTLDNAAATVQALKAGQGVTDTLTVQSLDGTATRDIVVAIQGTAEGPNLLANGGFETPEVTLNLNFQGYYADTWQLFDSIPGWTNASSVTELWRGDSGVVPTEGAQNLELDSWLDIDSLSQTVDAVTGAAYLLSFDVRGRETAETSTFDLSWNGAVIATIAPEVGVWRTYNVIVTGRAGPDVLAFDEYADGNDGYGALIDNVSLARTVDVATPPVAAADSYAATEDTPLTVAAAQGVLANDDAAAGGLRAVAGSIVTTLGGTVQLAAEGGFTYTPATNANGADSFGYTVIDSNGRTAAATVSLAVAAVNDAATIGGTTTGSVQEDGTLTASGTLTVVDPDAGEARFATPASLAGTYGAFTFDAATGAWGYTLDNAAANVQALNAGQTVTDTLTVASADGTATQAITVSIDGAAEPIAAGPNSFETVTLPSFGFIALPVTENGFTFTSQPMNAGTGIVNNAFFGSSNARTGDKYMVISSDTVTIARTDGADFDFDSVGIWTVNSGIQIKGFADGAEMFSRSFGDDRSWQSVSLGWTGIDTVQLISPTPFVNALFDDFVFS